MSLSQRLAQNRQKQQQQQPDQQSAAGATQAGPLLSVPQRAPRPQNRDENGFRPQQSRDDNRARPQQSRDDTRMRADDQRARPAPQERAARPRAPPNPNEPAAERFQRPRPPRSADAGPRADGAQEQSMRTRKRDDWRARNAPAQQDAAPARPSRYAPRRNTGDSAATRQRRARANARETKYALVGTGDEPRSAADLMATLPPAVALAPAPLSALFAPTRSALARASPAVARARLAGDYAAFLPDAPVRMRADRDPPIEHARFAMLRVRGASARARRRALDAVRKLAGPAGEKRPLQISA
jgi:hypothetical protein